MVLCQGCGHASAKDTYCEMCGAALPQSSDVQDDALSLMLGLVCTACDSYNDPGTSTCSVCRSPLTLGGGEAAAPAPGPAAHADPAAAAPAWMAAPEGQPLATAHAMQAVDLSVLAQAGSAGLAAPAPAAPAPSSSSKCSACGADVTASDKFCRHCGARVGALTQAAPLPSAPLPPLAPLPPPAATAASAQAKAAATMMMVAASSVAASLPKGAPVGATMFMPSVQQPSAGGGRGPSATMYFGAATVERFARLILVKGHTQFGTQWRLQAGQTLIGRNAGVVIFPDDKHLADRHCRLEFRGDELWVVPERTTNGVYLQVKSKAPIREGSEVICGSQRFRIVPDAERAPVLGRDGSDTVLYGSGVNQLSLVVMRVCVDPRYSEVYARPQRILSVGRHGCDLNFPDDAYLSTRHSQLSRESDGVYVEDLGSRNGTFMRIDGERKLAHGDAIMLGEQVMRVEVSLGIGGSAR